MGMHPRWVRPDHVIANTQRTVDQQFLFAPSEALRNIIGASAARAQQTHPVHIYWLEYNINHEQEGIAPLSDSLEHRNNVILFKQTFHKNLAFEINVLRKRDGAVFSTPARSIPCLDDMSVEQQFFYALLNPVKDGLVDRIAHWKGFSSYDQLACGKDVSYTFYDRTAWNNQKRKKKAKSIGAFMRRIRLQFTPLPGTEHMADEERQRYIRREVRRREALYREEREKEGRKAMGEAKLAKVDPRSRPRHPKPRTKKPLCHSSCPKRARAYIEQLKDFLCAYRRASGAYRGGQYHVEFPMGSCRPPLIGLAA